MSFPFQHLLLLLLLCFFMHACNSRPLGLLHKESGHFRRKDEGKESGLEETSTMGLMHRRRTTFEEPLTEEIHMAKFGGKKSPESLVSANKLELEAIDHLEQENTNKGTDHNKEPSSREVSQEDTQIKGWKILARSAMESKKQDHDTDENVKSHEEKGTVEDVVVMDYAQPHRKPPIHNLEH